MARLFESRQASTVRKADHRAEQAAKAKAFEVGDVLSSSWGYDQTQVDFYQIIDRKGSKLTIRKIAAEQTDNSHTGPDGRSVSSMAGYVVPMIDSFVGEAFTTIARGSSVKVDRHQHASKLEFETVAGCRVYRRSYVSWYA